MNSSSERKFERAYRCIKCGNIQTYMRNSFADNIAELPKCDIDGFVMMPASRGESGSEVRRIDSKRYVDRDGWAMLMKVGDVIDDRKVDLAFVEHHARTTPRRVDVLQGVRGDSRANLARLGTTTDHQTRANGTEFWVRFDEKIASADPPLRAVLGPHPQRDGLAIAASPRVPYPGDREQHNPVPASAYAAASQEEALLGMLWPETLVEYLDKSFPTTRWHQPGFYFDRSVSGPELDVFARMMRQLDPNFQPSREFRLEFSVACGALDAFERQKHDRLEPFQALGGRNPIAVIRSILVAMSVHGPRSLDDRGLLPQKDNLVTNALTQSTSDANPVALLITAVGSERGAVLELLRNDHKIAPSREELDGRYYNRFVWPGRDRTWDVLLGQPTEKGGAAAQALLQDFTKTRQPRLVLMVGMCGGLPENGAKEGMVIFGRQVFNYEPARLRDGASVWSPTGYRSSARVLDLANALAAEGEFGAIEVKTTKDYASGAKLIDDLSSELRQRILAFSGDILGFEMEGPDMLHAVWELQRTQHFDVAIVKGVSDFGDGKQRDDKDNRQRTATRNAARVALRLISSY